MTNSPWAKEIEKALRQHPNGLTLEQLEQVMKTNGFKCESKRFRKSLYSQVFHHNSISAKGKLNYPAMANKIRWEGNRRSDALIFWVDNTSL